MCRPFTFCAEAQALWILAPSSPPPSPVFAIAGTCARRGGQAARHGLPAPARRDHGQTPKAAPHGALLCNSDGETQNLCPWIRLSPKDELGLEAGGCRGRGNDRPQMEGGGEGIWEGRAEEGGRRTDGRGRSQESQSRPGRRLTVFDFLGSNSLPISCSAQSPLPGKAS